MYKSMQRVSPILPKKLQIWFLNQDFYGSIYLRKRQLR
ncbi:hypothetical protein X975_08768, partial [Stegodyphus mimosarum]